MVYNGISNALLIIAFIALGEEDLSPETTKKTKKKTTKKTKKKKKVLFSSDETIHVSLDPNQCHRCGRIGNHKCPFRKRGKSLARKN